MSHWSEDMLKDDIGAMDREQRQHTGIFGIQIASDPAHDLSNLN